MKQVLFFILVFVLPANILAQEVGDSLLFMPWKNIVLQNRASFNNYNDLTWGSGFLLKYHNDVIAVTARDLTGTWNNGEEKIEIDEFNKEVKSWEMYVADHPNEYALLDSLVMKERIEKSSFIFLFSVPILSFSIKKHNENIVPLNPNLERIPNNDTLYIVGYDDDHNLKIEQGIVETSLNDKYVDQDIRLKTNSFLYHDNFIGGPIVNKKGEVLGLVNRAYYLKKNRKGKIIREDKAAEGSYFEYFLNGTPIRLIFDKKFRKK